MEDRLRQMRLEDLRRDVAIGVDQLDRGVAMPFDEEAVERILARGRERLAAERKSRDQN